MDQAYLQEAIAKGRAGTSMPAWDGLLNPKQIEDVIAFLRSKQ
jgi:mono/diheme cytochrome c family protein